MRAPSICNITVVFVVTALFLAVLPARSGDRPVPADFHLTLERTLCEGMCPAYLVGIFADGRVEFWGRQFVATYGPDSSRVSADVVTALWRACQDANVFSLDTLYDAPVTGWPNAIITLTAGGRATRITDAQARAQTPLALRRVEVLMDSLLNTAHWITRSEGK